MPFSSAVFSFLLPTNFPRNGMLRTAVVPAPRLSIVLVLKIATGTTRSNGMSKLDENLIFSVVTRFAISSVFDLDFY